MSTPNAPNSKLKILCLHGYRQNDAAFREKTGSLRKIFKKYADFVFITAPHKPTIPEDALSDNGEGNPDPRGWWFSRPDQHFSSKDVTDLSTGFNESVEFIMDVVETQGPFDGLLGFSQGAAMASLFCALRESKEIALPLKFVILVAGFHSKSSAHAALNQVKITLPSLHIMGETDKVIPIEMSRELSQSYNHSVIVIHQGGHFVPTLTPFKQTISEFLERFINK
uniref:Serine hydrolase FSH domain-containing protein n=1 Tax=Plectus sambesii TaxID=2011161 RepID=A0A914W0G6_9BILA